TSVSIYGSESRHVLLMVDGIPFNNQISGQANPTRIGVEHIERIEVIKGASSSAWGSSLGGVINVITKDVGNSAKPQGRFTTSFAEFSTIKNSLEVSGRAASIGYFFSGNYMKTDGAQSASDTQEKKGFGKLEFALNHLATIKSSFGYSGGDVRYGTRSDGLNTVTPYISRYGNVVLAVEGESIKFNAAFKYNDQDINSEWIIASSGVPIVQTDNSSVYKGLSLNGSMDFRDEDVFVFGADFDWYRIKSANLFDSSEEASMQAPYANYIFKWKDWYITPGVRFDHNKAFGSQWSPSLGGVYHFSGFDSLRWRFKVAQDFNAPPIGWLYNEDPSAQVLTAPNPDLEAENSMVYATGLSATVTERLDMDLNFHWAEINDAIANETISGGLIKKVNKDRFRRQSVELDMRYDFLENLQLFFGGGFNHVKDLLMDKVVRDQGMARQRFKFGAYYKNVKGFGFNLLGSYNRWAASPSQANDRKVIVDAKLSQAFGKFYHDMDLEIFLNIYNLTNSKYWSYPALPFPRRYFEGGFFLKF
ncbi:Outer membrane vitamin B12 receptor BtuB, partial [hydrothermal vent metagenome]